MLTQLTVITHGRVDNILDTTDFPADSAPDWTFDLASAINQRDGLGNTEDQIDNSVIAWDTADFGIPAGGSADFLIFNWAEISDIDSPGRADDDEVAGVLADLVRARLPGSGTIDIHFIGHSRGSYVTLAAIQRLEDDGISESKIGHLKMTTLDPQDYGIPGINTEGIDLVVPAIVDEAENYYQYLFPLGGGTMEGADVNENLTVRLALWDGRSLLLGAEHLEVVDRYYWSIDTDDTSSAAYLRDEDLIEQGATIADDRQLLFGQPDPADQIVAMLDDLKDEFADGVGEFFADLASSLEDTFSGLEIPLIADQLDDIMEPVATSLRSFGAEVRDVLTDVLSFAAQANEAGPLATLQGAMYMILGPGRDGLDDLNPEVRGVLEPLAGALDAIHLDLLLDGPDLGDDIDPSDIVLSMGDDLGYWAQVDFHIGQFEVIDLPQFQVGLSSLVGDSLNASDAQALTQFLDGFGFEVTSETGLRTNLRWDLRLGLGVRERGTTIVDHFYINSGAKRSGLESGTSIEELIASLTVFATPPNESETFGTALADDTTTDNLRAELSVGLFQATVSDGTPLREKITAASPLNFSPVTPEDFSADFDVVVNEGTATEDIIRIRHDPGENETLAEFLLELNADLFSHYGIGIPDIGFTLDFGSVHRQLDPATPTTPSLVIAAHSADITSLTIRRSETSGNIGPEKFGFVAVQYEDARGKSLGFANNVISTAQQDGTQRLVAALPAPSEGISLERPDLVLWIGGTRTADGLTEGATPVVISEALDASVNDREGLQASAALQQLAGINGPESYRQAVETLIQTLVATSTGYSAGVISVEYEGPPGAQQLALVSHASPGGEAPMLTVTYKGIETSRLSLTAAIDITDPDYDEALEEEHPGDQRFFNRVTLGMIRDPSIERTDIFVPVLKGQAGIRLHVDANSENLEGFLQQSLGLGDSVIGLPSAQFDFIFDGGIDFTTFFGTDEEGSEPRDVFQVDALQFDNIVLDIGSTVETVILPVVETLLDALGPVLEIVGDGADSALNARLPLISDIIGDDVTLMDILDEIGIGDTIGDFVDAVSGLGSLADDLRAAVAGDEGFHVGGWELVMDRDSPLYFPRTHVPVPIDLAYAFGTAGDVSFSDFISTFRAFDALQATGFAVDLVSPASLINMVIGQPFNIVSYGFPRIDLMGANAAEASFDFDWRILSFAIAARLELFAELRFVYDSYGLQQIVDAYRAGATADWSDLIDGFAIRNNPDGYELYAAVGFEGEGSIGDPGVFEASGYVDLFAELGLELIDPNNDGKLRLDEIRDLTNDFTELEHLFCMFDIEGSFDVEVGGSATVAGTSIGSGSMGLSTGDFNLQDLLSDLFGICEEDETPVLAEEVVIDGRMVLRLNTGPFASNRIHGDVDDTDGGVDYRVTQVGDEVRISAFGETDQVYSGPYTRIVATGSSFADVFDLAGVSVPVQIDGRDGDDELTGGSDADLLQGNDGNDTLVGNAGNDHLIGGRGANTAYDGPGDDIVDLSRNSIGFVLTTQGGSDTVIGSPFDDTMTAGAGSGPVLFEGRRGNDRLTGGDQNDVLAGQDGDDILLGMSGDDQLDGGFGDDFLDGGAGDDLLVGAQGDDMITGGPGRDDLRGDVGNDAVTAGLGDFIAAGGTGFDTLLFDVAESPHEGTLTDYAYTQAGGPSVAYLDFESLAVVLGNGTGGAFQSAGNYWLTIDGPTLPLTSVTGGTGSDQVTIRALPYHAVPAAIVLGGDDDRLVVIDTQRLLETNLGTSEVNGDRLVIDRRGDPTGRESVLEPGEFRGAGIAAVRFGSGADSSVEDLQIEFGNGADQVTIRGTSDATHVTLNGNDGDDHYTVEQVGRVQPTLLLGDSGQDTATLLIDGNPMLLTSDIYGQLRFSVETLQVDNRAFTSTLVGPVNWVFDQDVISVGTTPILEALGAETVLFLSGMGSEDHLTVRDTREVSQRVGIDATNVRIEEGSNVLTFAEAVAFENFDIQATVDGLDGASGSVVSPDGRFVYVSGSADNAVAVFRRVSKSVSSESLQFVQVLTNGTLGVEGISGASDITMSSDGRHVYVSSGVEGTVGVFERISSTGRLVYRSLLQLSHAQPVSHIASRLGTDGQADLYATSGERLVHLHRDQQSGRLTEGETVPMASPATGLAVSKDIVAVSHLNGIEGWILLAGGTLPASSLTSASGGYTDITYAGGSKFLATWEQGYAEASILTSTIDIEQFPYPNSVTNTQGVAIDYDVNDNEGIVSIDPSSITPPPPEFTLRLDSLTAWGDGQDLVEGNVFTPGWELFVSVDGTPVTPVYESDDFDDAANNTIALGHEFPFGTLPFRQVMLWESDDAGGDDQYTDADLLRLGIFQKIAGQYALSYRVTAFGNTVGRATLNFTVYSTQDGPPPVQPVVLLQNTSVTGTAIGGDIFPDALSSSAGTPDFYGTSVSADMLALYESSVYSHFVFDGSRQAFAAEVNEAGPDDVQTVFSADGQFAYATSARYGTLSAYRVDPGASGGLRLIQVIPAGVVSGSRLVATLSQQAPLGSSTAVRAVYLTNPLEDSIFVFEQQLDGTLVLTQQVTDGIDGVDGLDGISDLVVEPRSLFPGPVRVYAIGAEDNSIVALEMDRDSGQLTYVNAFSHPDLNRPGRVVLAGDATGVASLYVTNNGNGSLMVFSRAAGPTSSASLTHLQTIFDGDIGASGQAARLGGPAEMELRRVPVSILFEDGLFVSSSSDHSINMFDRDINSGMLTLTQVLTEGIGGIRGIDGVTSLAYSTDFNDRVLLAAGHDDTIAVFSLTGDVLTQVQRIRNGAGGVQGILNPTDLTLHRGRLYVSAGGPETSGAGGIAVFDKNILGGTANDYHVRYFGMESLTVASGTEDDEIQAGEVQVRFTLSAGDGSDSVYLRNTPDNQATTVELGDGFDDLELLTTGAGSSTTIDGGAGNDNFRIYSTGANGATQLNGGAGDDSFDVTGTRLFSALAIDGGDDRDALCFDAQVDANGLPNTTDPVTPQTPNDALRVTGLPFGVDYVSIEEVCVLSRPVADAGRQYSILEGDTLTLIADGTRIPSGQEQNATYVWSIGETEGIATGPVAVLTWEDLIAAGVDDDGVYQVRVRVTSGIGNDTFSDVATAPLTVGNVAPVLSVTGAQTVEAGRPFQIRLTATDPGADAINAWLVNWGDGSPAEVVYGSTATTFHAWPHADANTNYVIQVLARDEDGVWGPASRTVAVVPARSIAGPAAVVEGASYTLQLANPAGAAISQWTVYWGDGNSVTVDGAAAAVTHTYADDGLYRIRASTTESGFTSPVSRVIDVSVRNADPLINQIVHVDSVLQNEPLQISVQASDPGLRDVLTWEFDLDNDGRFEVTSTSARITTALRDVGVHVFGVRVRDDDGGLSDTVTGAVTVENALPQIVSVSAGRAVEGGGVQIRVDAFDPGGDRLEFLFDLGGVAPGQVVTSAGAATVVFPDNGVYPVLVGVRDEHGAVVSQEINVIVDNLAPDYSGPHLSGKVTEGVPFTLSVTGRDAAGDLDPLTWYFDLDNDGTYETVNNTGIVTHTFPDDGVYRVPIRIADDDGGVTDVLVPLSTFDSQGLLIATDYVAFGINVLNGDPEVLTMNSPTIQEGQTATVSGTFTDPALGVATETFSGTAVWNDGTVTPLVINSNGTFFTSRAFPDDNPTATPFDLYDVTIRISDDDGGNSDTEICTGVDDNGYCIAFEVQQVISPPVTVENLAPFITSLVSDASALSGRSLDRTVTIQGAWDDDGVEDTHEVRVNWGDGSVEFIPVHQASLTFDASHTYAAGGVYSISVSVMDDDTGVSEPVTVAAILEGVGVVDQTLYIVGTDGRDHVVLRVNEKKDKLIVDARLNELPDDDQDGDSEYETRTRLVLRASDIERVVAMLFDGDDHYDGGSSDDTNDAPPSVPAMNIRQIVLGGRGNDRLHGGFWNDALFGEDGDDQLSGGQGDDILVGGDGTDFVYGRSGRDLIIGGRVDNNFDDASVLDDIDQAMADWSVGSLSDTLLLLGSALDDEDPDSLFSDDDDVVIAHGGDKVK